MVATGKVTRNEKRLSFTPQNVAQRFDIVENDEAGKLAKTLKEDEAWIKLMAELVESKKPSSTKEGTILQIAVLDFSFAQEKSGEEKP